MPSACDADDACIPAGLLAGAGVGCSRLSVLPLVSEGLAGRPLDAGLIAL